MGLRWRFFSETSSSMQTQVENTWSVQSLAILKLTTITLRRCISEKYYCYFFSLFIFQSFCTNYLLMTILFAAKLKVLWEPFIEPWQFLLTLVREQEMSIVLNRSVSTDIVLKSTTQLNINITESLVEVYQFLFSTFPLFL